MTIPTPKKPLPKWRKMMFIISASAFLLAVLIALPLIGLKLAQNDQAASDAAETVTVDADYRWDSDLQLDGVTWGLTKGAWKMVPGSLDTDGAQYTSTVNTCTLAVFQAAPEALDANVVDGDDRASTVNFFHAATGLDQGTLAERVLDQTVPFGDVDTQHTVDVLAISSEADAEKYVSMIGHAFTAHGTFVGFTTTCQSEADFRAAAGEHNSTFHIRP